MQRDGNHESIADYRRDAAKPYIAAGKWKPFEGTPEIVPGIRPKEIAGHTPGHVGYEVESQGQKLLIWGDVVHMAAVQMPHPEVGIVFDVDGPTAIKSRAALFAELAQEKTLVGGANYAVPSAGSPAKGRDRLHLAADYVHELELINEMLRMRHGASSHFYFLGEQYGPQFILRMEPP